MCRFLMVAITVVALAAGGAPAAASHNDSCDGKVATIMGTGGNDHLIGTDGDDVILGRGGDDRIEAGAGADLVCGDGGNDVVYAGLGRDRVLGGAGDDSLGGQGGPDHLLGEDGSDRLFGASNGHDDDHLEGGDGNDILHGGIHGDLLQGGAGDDVIHGGSGTDRLFGDGGLDRLLAGPGDDELYGGAEPDHLEGGTEDDWLDGEDGVDHVDGTAGNDTILLSTPPGHGVWLDLALGEMRGVDGTETMVNVQNASADYDGGRVVLLGNETSNTLRGASGNDRIVGRGGDDNLHGGFGVDALSGGAGNDAIWAYENPWLVRGGYSDAFDLPALVEDDVLTGGSGNDRLVGGVSATGGAGNDVFEIADHCWTEGGRGDAPACYGETVPTISGGKGRDGIEIWAWTNRFWSARRDDSFLVHLPNEVVRNTVNGEQWTVRGLEDANVAAGGDDMIYGTTVGNRLVGGPGDDTIFGYGGNDILHGGSPDHWTDRSGLDNGSDVLRGGAATDTCYTSRPPQGEGPADLVACEVIRRAVAQ